MATGTFDLLHMGHIYYLKEAKKALDQINKNQYIHEIVQRGFTNIIKIGIAFSGKNFKVAAAIQPLSAES